MASRAIEDFVTRAVTEPFEDRTAMYETLLDSPTYLLQVGQEAAGAVETKVYQNGDLFSLWADPDPRWGSVWVPMFTGPERVTEFVERLDAGGDEGRVFQWARHQPGDIYATLQGMPGFAGIRLDPTVMGGVRIEWSDVNALSEGRAPEKAPVLFQLPVARYRVPEAARCLFSRSEIKINGAQRRQAIFPEVGEIELQDFRRLVELDMGKEGPAWTPCRHFISLVRGFLDDNDGRRDDAEVLVRSLVEFGMYGEAEVYCERLEAEPEHAALALRSLAAVYLRSGKPESCVEVCRRGIEARPDERELYLSQARAHAQTEDLHAAREVARRGLDRFERDAELERFL